MTAFARTVAIVPALVLAACAQAPAEAPPVTDAAWTVDGEASQLHYVTVKSGEIAENNKFTGLSGSVSPAGAATIEIDLASVETGVDIRDERMRDVFFEVADYPTATVSAQIDPELFDGMGVGDSVTQPLDATVTVKGVETAIQTEVSVTRVSDDRVLAVSTDPVIVYADALDLTGGLALLQELAGLPSITPAVPFSFSIAFER
ncbi:MAG: YceI family protein [Pseudomonadota bacterium]